MRWSSLLSFICGIWTEVEVQFGLKFEVRGTVADDDIAYEA